jgi:DNA-binding NarL/FixJ family response regulator
VYIVDDHRFFVAGLSSLINHASDMEVCGSAPDGRKVVSEVRRLHPDLVLMDVKLPRTSGLAVARNLRRFLGDVPILFISSLAEQGVREEAHNVGALGFLEKTQEPRRILDGIRRALGL